MKVNLVFFFFSSRRRHTRSLCDWSSDVCSSDLEDVLFANYYFRVASAWAAGQTVPEAWRTAFATADRGDAAGVEEMLLGINAHVQRDEAYVISEVGVRTPDGRTRKPDPDRFNVILERSY